MDSFEVKVYYECNGVEGMERYIDVCMDSCLRRTRRKHGRDRTRILRTVTRDLTWADKCIPPPPEEWGFKRFKVKQKKNRFGRLVNCRPDEEDILD